MEENLEEIVGEDLGKSGLVKWFFGVWYNPFFGVKDKENDKPVEEYVPSENSSEVLGAIEIRPGLYVVK